MPSQAQVVNLIGEAVKGYSKEISEVYAIERDLGLVKLGSGHYSTVYKHPFDDNLVIKVCRDINDGWLDYAAYCIQYAHEDERLLRVLDARVFGSYYVAVMERLEPMKIPYAGVTEYQRFYKACGEIKNAATYSPGSRLAKLQQEVRGINDLHDDNAMFRGDVVVLTDPFSSSNSYYKKYTTANGRIDVTIRLQPSDEELLSELAPPKLQPPTKIAPKGLIPGEFRHIDFGPIERRALERMQQIPKLKPIAWDWGFGLPKVGDQVFVQIKKRDQVHDAVHYEVIPRERALVVKDGSPAAIRAEKEDHMLRIRTQHDNTAFIPRVQRSLLPFCRSRRVQTARIAIVEGNTGPTAGYVRNAGWAIAPAIRYIGRNPPEQDAMVA